MATRLRIPLATYRLQLRADFTFEAAIGVVDYLRELGISHVFCSPYLQAAPGSGQVLDIVPNHMAITGHHNRWWWDTLENGEASRYAPYFDIEWNAPEERLRHKILLPVLGDHYGRVLAVGEIVLARQTDTSLSVITTTGSL